jgi:hypothetical protein
VKRRGEAEEDTTTGAMKRKRWFVFPTPFSSVMVALLAPLLFFFFFFFFPRSSFAFASLSLPGRLSPLVRS